MTINYQFDDVDAHGALIRSQAASLGAEHPSIVRDVLAAGDFWGGAGSVTCQEFQLGLASCGGAGDSRGMRYPRPSACAYRSTPSPVPAQHNTIRHRGYPAARRPMRRFGGG